MIDHSLNNRYDGFGTLGADPRLRNSPCFNHHFVTSSTNGNLGGVLTDSFRFRNWPDCFASPPAEELPSYGTPLAPRVFPKMEEQRVDPVSKAFIKPRQNMFGQDCGDVSATSSMKA